MSSGSSVSGMELIRAEISLSGRVVPDKPARWTPPAHVARRWRTSACKAAPVSDDEQLAALAELHELLAGRGIDYWLFGGWAVDFHADAVTCAHDDLDIAVWAADRLRVGELLAGAGWRLEADESADGYVVYARGPGARSTRRWRTGARLGRTAPSAKLLSWPGSARG